MRSALATAILIDSPEMQSDSSEMQSDSSEAGSDSPEMQSDSPKADGDYFLGVRRSASGQGWRERLDGNGLNIALDMVQRTGMPELIARVLAGRGVSAPEAETFLAPSLRALMPDPSVLSEMDDAVERLADAVGKREPLAVIGDYDVDGAASCALMNRFFRHHGIEPEIYVPDRVRDGYGPNREMMRELIERGGARLIVTVDCGAGSHEALEEAANLGVDVVVLDHHPMDSRPPRASAVVDPNRDDDLSGLGYLCAAGVVFMTLAGLTRRLRERGFYEDSAEPDLLSLLDLVALATVCDVVPLAGLNRAFVVKGLQVMRRGSNVGLSALSRAARLSSAPRVWELGFVLGPRINAGGRIGDCALGARLLGGSVDDEADAIAARLEELNVARREAEARMYEEASAQADRLESESGASVLVVHDSGWHPGIVGLLASRLKSRHHRPAFAVHFGEDGKGAGSGRSIEGVDIGAAVREAVGKGILLKGGGHAMAAGITVERERLDELRVFFEDRLAEEVRRSRESRSLRIDAVLNAGGASLDLAQTLERAGPYGAGHPEPIFVLPSHSVRYARIVAQDHVSARLAAGDGSALDAFAPRCVGTPLGDLLMEKPPRLHLAGALEVDSWNGRKKARFRVVDAAIPVSASA